MTRALIASAVFGDYLPTGEWCALLPRVGVYTHLGLIPLPPGETYGPLYLRCTAVNGFRFAGQAHDTVEPACWEWDTARTEANPPADRPLGDWTDYPQPCCGQSPVIYDADGVLHRAACAPPTGSQGWRFIGSAASVPPAATDWGGVTGDATYGPWNGLSEYTDLGDGLHVGQAHGFLAAVVWDGSTLRLLETGARTFIRAHRNGEAVTIAMSAPEGVVLLSTTMAALRALPPVSVMQPPEPPITPPKPPDPPVQPPEPPVVPPDVLPYRLHRKDFRMDGKTVVLRGPGGKLGRPAALNTGPWATLGEGWRGWIFDGEDKADARYHHTLTDTLIVSVETGSCAGCDATEHSGGLNQQFYYKPDGDTSQGWAETWQVYDGNANKAIEAQVEYAPGSGGDAGAFFSYPLAVEVVG